MFKIEHCSCNRPQESRPSTVGFIKASNGRVFLCHPVLQHWRVSGCNTSLFWYPRIPQFVRVSHLNIMERNPLNFYTSGAPILRRSTRHQLFLFLHGRKLNLRKQCRALPYSTMNQGGLPRFALLYLQNVQAYKKFSLNNIRSPEFALASGIFFLAFWTYLSDRNIGKGFLSV